jgi:murein DD-endopeptidase MepM/ murein hydrolase activator NlpD
MRGTATICALLLLTAPALTVPALTLRAWAEGTSCKPATATHLNTNKPLTGKNVRLVSGFGLRVHPILGYRRMHPGVDWGAPRGTPVIAAAAGLVTPAGFKSTYGNTVIIDHGAGFETVYAHLSAVAAHVGDCVDAGANIGAAGSTGLSSHMGVHFEVRRGGVAVDPMRETMAEN